MAPLALLFVLAASLLQFAPIYANQASTTRYWDCSGGSCGCGYLSRSGSDAHCHSNSLFLAPTDNSYGATFYGSAAVSEALGGGFWLSSACGTCWRVTGTSNIGSNVATTTLILKGTNFCPPANPACSNGRAHFDIAAPGFDFSGASLSNKCSVVEPDEAAGFSSCGAWMISSADPNQNCDCTLFTSDVLRAGCENFLSLRWNNVDVSYEEVTCPSELSRLPCWDDNGGTWPSEFNGFCEDPGVTLSSGVTSAPYSMETPTSSPSRRIVSSPEMGTFCSWSMCAGGPEGGDWCNESEERCISCGSGSRWCKADTLSPATTSPVGSDTERPAPSATPSVTPSAAPSVTPSAAPSAVPFAAPSAAPSEQPSAFDENQANVDPPATTLTPIDTFWCLIWDLFIAAIEFIFGG